MYRTSQNTYFKMHSLLVKHLPNLVSYIDLVTKLNIYIKAFEFTVSLNEMIVIRRFKKHCLWRIVLQKQCLLDSSCI